MSQFSTVTLDQARAAKADLKSKLARDFAGVASPVVGIGLTHLNTAEWGLKVNLEHAPTPEEKKNLPDRHQGVRVLYEITGLPKKAL